MIDVSYTIKTPFNNITRIAKNHVILTNMMKEDVCAMHKAIGHVDEEMLSHKLDWYNNEYNVDYELDMSCFLGVELNYDLDHSFGYYAALFRLLNIPMNNASDRQMFELVF